MEHLKRSTFSILFYLKKKALKKDGTTPIIDLFPDGNTGAAVADKYFLGGKRI